MVVSGLSAVDTSLLTGEPVPAEVGPGDGVTGGCVNAGGRLVARATAVGADTQLAQMTRLVTEAQAGKAPVQRLADRISAVFVPAVIAVAIATLAGWLAAGQPPGAAFTARGLAAVMTASPVLVRALIRPRISRVLREQVMPAVTSVNDCATAIRGIPPWRCATAWTWRRCARSSAADRQHGPHPRRGRYLVRPARRQRAR